MSSLTDSSRDERKDSEKEDGSFRRRKTSDASKSTGTTTATTSKDDGGKNIEVSETVEVPRNITLIGGISFIVGTIIGSGIFVSPRGVAEGAGSVGMTMVSWVICGIISMLGAFCYAELGTVVKESGADYAYIHHAYGPIFSYTFSWVNNMLVKPASLATISLTCSEYIMILMFDDGCGAPEIHKKLLSIFLIFVLAAINVYSIKLATRIQIVFTVAKLIALIIIIVGGIVMLFKGYTKNLATGFDGTETNPGTIAVGFYSGMWAYDGWNTANFMTEEIINPQRNLPLAIMIGLPLTIVIYILTNISYFTVLSIDDMLSSPAVAITWAERVIPGAVWLIPIFVALSTFGTGNGSLFSGGRLMFVAARNDHLPEVLAMVHSKKFTPVPAIVWTVFLAVIFLIPGNIGALIDFVSFLSWIFYGMNMLGVIIFRYSKQYKDLHRPVRSPIFIPILAFLSSVFLVVVPIITDPRIEFLYAVLMIAIGFVFWLPFVFFKVRFNFMKSVTMFFQLFLQVLRPKQTV
jgi:L-type amino acid transporter 9